MAVKEGKPPKQYRFRCMKCGSDHQGPSIWKHEHYPFRRRKNGLPASSQDCLWCGKPVRGEPTRFFVLRGVAHPGECTAQLRSIKARTSHQVLAILAERSQ